MAAWLFVRRSIHATTFSTLWSRACGIHTVENPARYPPIIPHPPILQNPVHPVKKTTPLALPVGGWMMDGIFLSRAEDGLSRL